MSLGAFLERYRVDPGVPDVSHTSFVGGRYYVPASALDRFYGLYCDALAAGGQPTLVERHRHIGPTVIDLDFRAPAPAGGAAAGALYTPDELEAFVQRVFSELAMLVELPAGARCFVLEKPPRLGKGGAVVKHGAHLVVACAVTHPAVQHMVREALLPYLSAIFSCLPPDDDEACAAAYDAAVIERNGWLMYGSRKTGDGGGSGSREPHAWELTRVLELGAGGGVADAPPETVAALRADLPTLVRTLSIRNKHVETPLRLSRLARVRARVEADDAARLARAQEAEARRAEAEEAQGRWPTPSGEPLLELVACLGAARADRGYMPWYLVARAVCALTGGSQEGLQAFHAWAKSGGAAYDAQACDAKWRSLAREGAGASAADAGIAARSLRAWARADSPEAYAAWCRAHPDMARPTAEAGGAAEGGAGAAGPRAQLMSEEEGRQVGSRLLDAFGMASAEVVATSIDPASRSLKVDMRTAGGADAQLVLSLDGLKARLTEGGERVTFERFLHDHESRALKVPPSPDLAALSAFAKRSVSKHQDWYVVQPNDGVATFRMRDEHGRTAEAELLNMDTPKNTSATLSTGDFKGVGTRDDKSLLLLAHKMTVLEKLKELGMSGIVQLGSNNTIVINFPQPDLAAAAAAGAGAGGERRTRSDYMFLEPMREGGVVDSVVPLSDREWYVFRKETGLWELGSANNAAGVLRAAVASGEVRGLQPLEVAYATSNVGAANIVRSVQDDLQRTHRGFAERLNRPPPACVAFNNGMYDGATGELRPLRREDYLSETVGYGFVPPAEEVTAEVREFFAEIFPDPQERAFVLAAFGCALFGRGKVKYFLLLTDEVHGSNGKTASTRFVESCFGMYAAPVDRNFLARDAHPNPNSAAANLLATRGKRMARFDELDKHMRIDLGRIKDLSSGASVQRGRSLRSNTVQEFEWTALVVIACNEGNFPTIDGADMAFLNRMKALKMRSLFVPAEELQDYDGVPHVFARKDESFLNGLLESDAHKSACVVMLAEAWRACGGRLPADPPAVKAVVEGIACMSDPRMDWVCEWVDRHLDFNPARRPEDKGRRYYAYVKEKELRQALWTSRECSRDFDRRSDTKTDFKRLLSAAMRIRGRVCGDIRPQENGVQLNSFLAYDRVRMREDGGLGDDPLEASGPGPAPAP